MEKVKQKVKPAFGAFWLGALMLLAVPGGWAQSPPSSELQELSKRLWRGFAHCPTEASGFMVIPLPVRHHGSASPAIAQALFFLIHQDLTWTSGHYQLGRFWSGKGFDDEQLESLGLRYNAADIDSMIRQYADTPRVAYALGGSLDHSAQGWQLELELFDRRGKKCWSFISHRHSNPWELLGESSTALMTHIDKAPSPALQRFLAQPRTQHDLSLQRLGEGLLWELNEQDDQAQKNYAQMLHDDPEFLPLRCYLQHTTPAYPKITEGPELARWIAWAKTLVGDEHPSILARELKIHTVADRKPLLERSLRVAAVYPNARELLNQLASQIRQLPPEFGGPILSGSIANACHEGVVFSWEQSSDRDEDLTELSLAALGLGYPELADLYRAQMDFNHERRHVPIPELRK